VIHTLNQVPVTNLVELRVALDKLSAGEPVALQIQRSGRLRYLTFEMR
jgi:S1-C subfamily serine protease